MTQPLARIDDQTIARPLRVLVTLIHADIKQGRDAAERAGLPYFQAAGEKLLEAKAQLKHGEFTPWVKRHFTMSTRMARQYMSLAIHVAEKGSAVPFASLSEFIRQTSNPHYNRRAAWREPVKQIVNRVDTATLNLKRDELRQADEREAQRVLALHLIAIGYKVLARKLHPDTGGSHDAITRLNAVRERLKQCLTL